MRFLTAAAVGISLTLTPSLSARLESSLARPIQWAPPVLVNPEVITVPDVNGRVAMDPAKDYIVHLNHLRACGGLWLRGGRNVVVIGGRVTIPGACGSAYDCTAIKVQANASTVHLEGILIDGPYTHDGIVTASPQTTLQVENVRIEGVRTLDDNHPDCLQTQAGLGRLRVDRFTCDTELQGFFLKIEGGNAVGPVDIRNTNVTGVPGKYFFVQESSDIPVRLSNVWIHTLRPWAPFGFLVYPQADGRTFSGTYNPRRRSVVSPDGGRVWFIGSNIQGVIRKGLPPGGDIVPTGAVGTSYMSPGYLAIDRPHTSSLTVRR